jgi:hypothetical protein
MRLDFLSPALHRLVTLLCLESGHIHLLLSRELADLLARHNSALSSALRGLIIRHILQSN